MNPDNHNAPNEVDQEGLGQEGQVEQNGHPVEQRRTCRDYNMPFRGGLQFSITRPAIEANNFKIDSMTMQLVQHNKFGGLNNEDPNSHLRTFIEICDTFKINGASEEAIKLRLFPFSLEGKARDWLNSLPNGSITTWAILIEKFLAKYFPPSKTAKLMRDISTFMQGNGETLYDAWERFKELLRKCPHHGLATHQQVWTFYNGLQTSTMIQVDGAAGGSLMNKYPEDAYEILEDLSSNNYHSFERQGSSSMGGAHQVDQLTSFAAQITAQFNSMNKRLDALTLHQNQVPMNPQVNSIVAPPININPSLTVEELINNNEEVNYIGGQPRYMNHNNHNAIPTHYNPDLRNHPNFSWKNNTGTGHPPGFNSTPRPTQNVNYNQQGPSRKLSDEILIESMQRNDARITSVEGSLRVIESQLGQIANALSLRPQGSLPTDTTPNPKGDNQQCKAVTLRSGKELESIPLREKSKGSNEKELEELIPCIPNEGAIQDGNSQEPAVEVLEKKKERIDEATKKKEARIIYPPPPFPQRLKKSKLDQQFQKFLEIFKKLQINIPFAEALEQMPSYVKFMKDILSKKRRFGTNETVALTQECSAILQKKLPPKLKDPGSFTIPCSIGYKFERKALCDLGASINLMPLSIYRKLGLGEISKTSITLQLADRTLAFPKGIVEDVLVKVDKFIFPADFVVLDMEEDREVPIIVGRPFLATGRTLIDVHKGELTMRVNDEQVTFNVLKALKFPHREEDNMEVVNHVSICDYTPSSLSDEHDMLLTQLLTEDDQSDDDEAIQDCLQAFEKQTAWFRRPEPLEMPEKSLSAKPSIVEPPSLELKPLPEHLTYVYLGDDETLPVIINSNLTSDQRKRLIELLKQFKMAIGWTIADIRGISPSLCMHKILLEESFQGSIEPQRRLSPPMKEVVKKEIIKWLDAGIIYPISVVHGSRRFNVYPRRGG
ncbi:hypothetical protein KSP39_PZI013849 [Platanthera zijinensis]|uniref:Retrotransposon gag domain-containing protein n=1 Tax=Platanthera zijinensis TaxID=2320716 RepID=A0AAP0BC82_9ASPA